VRSAKRLAGDVTTRDVAWTFLDYAKQLERSAVEAEELRAEIEALVDGIRAMRDGTLRSKPL
jgi:hypothetical protein